MKATVSYLLMLKKIYQFKAKDSEIKNYIPCLGNIWKYFTMNNMEKNKTKRIFSVNFNPIDNNNIIDIRKYLMKKKKT